MTELTPDQLKSYKDLIAQRKLNPISYSFVKKTLDNYQSMSLEQFNAQLSARSGIDISKFKSIVPVFSSQDTKEVPKEQKAEQNTGQSAEYETKQNTEQKTSENNSNKPSAPSQDEKSNSSQEDSNDSAAETSFYACGLDSNSDLFKLKNPIITSKNTEEDLLKAIKGCNAWAESNQSLYAYNKGQCLLVADTSAAKALCYASIIPKNNIPASEQTTPVYNCNNNQKAGQAFTYAFGGASGEIEHLRACAEWISNDGSSLAYGNNACETYPTAESAMSGCLGELN